MRTRTTIAVVLAVGMFLALTGTARANLILNPGFEADSNGDQSPENWSYTGGDRVKDFDLGIAPHSGSFQWQFQNNNATLSQPVTLTDAGAYELSMWIANRNDGGNHLNTVASGQVKYELLDNLSNPVTPDGSASADYDTPRGTYVQWTRSFDSLLPGDYTVRVSTGVGSGANQGMGDDFSLIAVGPPVPTIHYIGGDDTVGIDTMTGTQGNETYGGGVTGAKVIRVEQNIPPDNQLNIAELQAFDTGNNNVALASAGGVALQSSTGWGGVASRAIDGNTNGNYGSNSVQHTNDSDPWWQVTLPSPANLDSVHIWGRTDCCASRLNDFDLVIKDASNVEIYRQQHTGVGTEPGSNRLISLASLASADLTTTLADIDTYVFDIGSNDQLIVDDNGQGGVFNTILDLNNATLEIRLWSGGGTLSAGQSFELLVADEILGSFDSIILPSLPGGLGFDTSQLTAGGDGTLTIVSVIPEPMTMLAVALGISGLGGYIRKRRRA